jgi:hypothetical protein
MRLLWENAMALKDLIVDKTALTEEAIEKIVSGKLHYDVEEKAISLTPAGGSLPAKKKLLTFLVGLQGWRFVTDEPVATDASPAELEEHLGIPGGTVRPMLMDLRDRHLLSSKKRRYSVRANSLHAIREELDGSDEYTAKARPAKAKPRSTPSKTAKEANASGRRRGKSNKTGSQAALFGKWIEDGFFDEQRTLAELVKKFRRAGIVVSRTSMPQLLLKAVRNGQLERHEAAVSGKNVWVYQRPKAKK